MSDSFSSIKTLLGRDWVKKEETAGYITKWHEISAQKIFWLIKSTLQLFSGYLPTDFDSQIMRL